MIAKRPTARQRQKRTNLLMDIVRRFGKGLLTYPELEYPARLAISEAATDLRESAFVVERDVRAMAAMRYDAITPGWVK